MVKLTPTGVKINTNLVWTSHNTGGFEFNTGVFAVFKHSQTLYYAFVRLFLMLKW